MSDSNLHPGCNECGTSMLTTQPLPIVTITIIFIMLGYMQRYNGIATDKMAYTRQLLRVGYLPTSLC